MKRKLTTLIILLFALKVNYGQTFTNDLIDILPGTDVFNVGCVVYKPLGFDGRRKYPLVIFFHGAGEAGLNLSLLYNAGLPQVLKGGYKPSFDFIMIAPQHSSYSPEPRWLPAIIENARQKFKIDTTRIYLTGLSAGGYPAYGSQLNVSTALAKKIAAIVVISGATQDINKNNFDWWKVSKTPVWSVVGASDISYKEQNVFMIDSINKRVPGAATLTVRSGVGHGGWNDVYNGTVKNGTLDMWQWLYQFTREGKVISIPPVSIPSTAAFDFKVGDTLKIKLIKLDDSTLIFQRVKN